jgi:hypothetical protein
MSNIEAKHGFGKEKKMPAEYSPTKNQITREAFKMQ